MAKQAKKGKQVKVPKAKKTTKATKKRNKFSGADDIYLTGRSIAVRRVSSRINKKGEYEYTEKTTYHPRTSENMKAATSIYGLIRKGR